MLTTCDACGFPCDAVFVGSTFAFTCDICEAIEESESFARTTARTESYAEWSERNEAADRIAEGLFENAFALLESLARTTARIGASSEPARP